MADGLPTTGIQNLAVFALANEKVRKDASVAGAFRTVLQATYPEYGQLKEEELQYCEGWLYLARLEHSGDVDVLDHHIVTAVQASLYEAGQTRAG